MQFIKKLKEQFINDSENEHMKAYAAQSALYVIISLVPCILLLLTLIQYTPVTKGNIISAVVELFPNTINVLLISLINEVYSQSTSIIPLTAVVTMWSASRGVLAMSNGMNFVYGQTETRGYIYLRIRAAIYTVIFLVAIVLTMVLLVFGNSISFFAAKYIPFLTPIIEFIISIRVVTALWFLIFVFTTAYTFLPNTKVPFTKQVPGAIFASISWLLCSLVFSVYLQLFRGFSAMYGSLTTIVLIMFWLNFCMYFLLLGAKINVMLLGDELDFLRRKDKKEIEENK